MARKLMKSLLLCVILAVPAVAQERVQLPEPGQTDEWCITPIVWNNIDDLAQQRAEMERALNQGYLGVRLEPLDEARAKQLNVDKNVKGVVIAESIADSPAAKAGVKTNDVVLSVDGRPVANEQELTEAVRAHKPGETVSLEVLRDGKRQKIDVTLGSRPLLGDFGSFTLEPGNPRVFRGRLPETFNLGEPYVMLMPGQPRLGVSVLPMTDDLRRYFGVESGKGVLVSAVAPGSPAESAGLRAGDVIVSVDGQPVAQSGDISRALRKDSDQARAVAVEVFRDKTRLTFTASIPAQKLMMNEE